MTKEQWGPRGWAWLHTLAIYYSANPTPQEQRAMFARFWSFIQKLPCPECRLHTIKYARAYPPDFSGSAGFQTWVWRFHNAVNFRLDKPLITSEEYNDIYADDLSKIYAKYI